MDKSLEDRIFEVDSQNFNTLALEIFRFQAANVQVYKDYLSCLKVNPANIDSVSKIPFIPIDFFKRHKVIAIQKEAEHVFESSGTTGFETSKHFVASLDLYRKSFSLGFERFYGNPKNYCFIALLPSYIERPNSSLVYMAQGLMALSENPMNGFYLTSNEEFLEKLHNLDESNTNTILIGVTFALIELAAIKRVKLSNTIIMETGGMKGRRKEMIRDEVHNLLKKSFGVDAIHSEYGMTELISQAYSKGNGIFFCPPWMKILVRDPYDPFSLLENGNTGAINVIDLANLYSCSFIQTDDLGVTHSDGSFKVLGRLDGSQVRGCNLLLS